MSVVLVVGGSRGIGAAVAKRFIDSGDDVAITCRDASVDEDTKDPLRVVCDVRDESSVDEAIGEVERRLGPPDIVVVNAGVTSDQLLARMDEPTWAKTLDTNLSGAYRVAKRVSRPMMRARRGSVVFISSVAGWVGAAGQVNYAASKAGLMGLARSMARELGSRGVRVNVVAPGPTATDMTDALTEQQRDALRALVPLGRFGEPDEIAEVVEMVARATYMNGAIVPVDGGASMGL